MTHRLDPPISADFPQIRPTADLCQRWSGGRHSFVRASEGGFQRSRYTVEPVDEATAKSYCLINHYSGTYPAAARRYALYYWDSGASRHLVGVAVFGIPVQAKVLTGVLPDLQPYSQALELSRFVLEGEPQRRGGPGGRAPANAESFFLARCKALLAEDGVQAVVAFSDPVPRTVCRADGSEGIVWPGHYGLIYQASNAIPAGRGTARTLLLMPDATVISARALAKVRARDQGHEYLERRLVAAGADPRIGPDPAAWLRRALLDVGVRRVRHPGNLRYVIVTAPRFARRLRILGAQDHYPKPDGGFTVVPNRYTRQAGLPLGVPASHGSTARR